ncbi:MAG: 8-amino-7-oxononanoate synthase [Nitrospirales bacterium]|nr:8-amino-7-oxononanoate synthase [Nitrospirales bacterium]
MMCTRGKKTFRQGLEELTRSGLFREIRDRGPSCSTARIVIDGKEYRNFSSNDYLGLAHHPAIRRVAEEAAAKYGFGSGSSRLLAGGTELHAALEEEIAGFKGTEAALVLNSGYSANITAIPALAGEGDLIFSDELNHASIIDGCRLSRAQRIIYRHCDREQLSELLKKAEGKKKLVVTDSVFSMDGDLAPLKEINELCLSQGALLYIDDAHGTGVLANGKGGLAHHGIEPAPHIIQMGTFSKALGSFGGFIAAEKETIQWIINTGRGFIFSTALPAPVIAASIEALRIIAEEHSLTARLWRNRDIFMEGVRKLGFETLGTESPIIPLMLPEQRENPSDPSPTLALSQKLWDRGIYAACIRPPTVKIPRIRISITAAHTEEEISELLKALSFAK